MEFKSAEFIVDRSVRADFSIEAVPALAIGWIPHFRSLSSLPPGSAFRSHPGAAGRIGTNPFAAVFSSGNPRENWVADPARAGFREKREELLKFASTRNFRVLLAVDSLRIWFSETGEFAKVTFDSLSTVGYTRIVAPLGAIYLKGAPGGPGGSSHCQAFTDSDGLHKVRFWQRYKIGTLCDIAGWAMSGKWAPSAFIQIEYQFSGRSLVGIGFIGSSIPSVSMYIDWDGLATHDMVTISRDQIDGFLNAGKCTDAQDDLLAVWSPEPGSILGSGI